MYLTKINPARNMRRFYLISVGPTMLGEPDRVIVEVEPDLQQIRLTPTVPGHKGAYALSDGGLSPRRFRSKEIVSRWPEMVGKYEPRNQAAAVVFVKVEAADDDA